MIGAGSTFTRPAMLRSDSASRSVHVYAFPDDGVAEPGDADLDFSDWQVGFLDPVSAFYQDDDDLVVTRFLPQNIAGAISAARAAGNSHVGILIAPNDNGTDAIYSTEWTMSGLFHTIAPRLWLYLRQPGDFNADGFVDGADYVVWRNSNGQIRRSNWPADANNNGQVIDTRRLSNLAQPLRRRHSATDSLHFAPFSIWRPRAVIDDACHHLYLRRARLEGAHAPRNWFASGI